MKNKHQFESFSHNPELFGNFCHVASNFDEGEILEVTLMEYLDDRQIKGLTERLQELIDINTKVYHLPNGVVVTVNHENQGVIEGSLGDE